MKNEKDQIVLQKNIQRIGRTIAYCAGQSYDNFELNTMLQEACVFNVLQIGELAKRGLSEAFIFENPDIPWKQIYGLRNRIVHGYEGVRLNIVWDTISYDFPSLLVQLKAVVDAEE